MTAEWERSKIKLLSWKFLEVYSDQQMPEEGWRAQQPKWDDNNKDGDISLTVNNGNNNQFHLGTSMRNGYRHLVNALKQSFAIV